jgi:hypothetical protein
MKPIHFLGAGNGSYRSANGPAHQHVFIFVPMSMHIIKEYFPEKDKYRFASYSRRYEYYINSS